MSKARVVVEELCFHLRQWILLEILGKALCLLRTLKAKVELLGVGIIGLDC